MKDAEGWAAGIIMADGMANSGKGFGCDIRGLVHRVTKVGVLCAGPNEVFSKERPTYIQQSSGKEYAPIDELYGRYTPEAMRMELFIERIKHDASRYRTDPESLLKVVRIHEYAHAVVHVGVDLSDVGEWLGRFDLMGVTDWGAFHADRTRACSRLGPQVHELLAQAITWAAVCKGCAEAGSDHLLETFEAIEPYQPPEYQLPEGVKAAAEFANWPLVMRAARGEITSFTDGTSSMRERLVEIVLQTGLRRTEGDEDKRRYKRAFGDARAIAKAWTGSPSQFNWPKTVLLGWVSDARHDVRFCFREKRLRELPHSLRIRWKQRQGKLAGFRHGWGEAHPA